MINFKSIYLKIYWNWIDIPTYSATLVASLLLLYTAILEESFTDNQIVYRIINSIAILFLWIKMLGK